MSKPVALTSQIQIGFDNRPKKMLKDLVPPKEKEEEFSSSKFRMKKRRNKQIKE